ncbi:MAG: hypothetical protein RR356_01670 [Bacteroidales bacterium]
MNRITPIFLILNMIILFASCHQKSPSVEKQENKKVEEVIDLNDSLPGRVVMETNADGTPKTVVFYKVDENGVLTEEKVREVHYFPGKKKYTEGNFIKNKRDGEWRAYYQDGTINTEAFYIDGKEDGKYTVYHENGKPYYIGYYDHGICVGTWAFYDDQGNIIKELKAAPNTIVCETCPRCVELRKKSK